MTDWEFEPYVPGIYEVDHGDGCVWLNVTGTGGALRAWVPKRLLDRGYEGRAVVLLEVSDGGLDGWAWLHLRVPDCLPDDVG